MAGSANPANASLAASALAGSPQVQGQVASMNAPAPAPAGFFPTLPASSGPLDPRGGSGMQSVLSNPSGGPNLVPLPGPGVSAVNFGGASAMQGQPSVGAFEPSLPPNMQGQSFSYGPDAQGSPQVQGQVASMNAPAPAGFFPNMAASAVGDAAFSQRQATPTSGKGGTSTATPAPASAQPAAPAPQYAPVAPQQQGFNVNQASASALQGALGSTQRAMQGPLNIGAYANPYTSAVINRTQQDIERQRQMAMNTLGAQATAAKAFGGSRQGVAEGVMAGEYGRMAGDMAAQQRQANYSQALQVAMADRQARLGAASQLGGLGQQAFQTGQTIQQQQAQQGLLQQGIQQALIDAARGQYAGYTGAPTQALQAPLAALGVTPNQSTTTNSMQPGLFNYLQLGASMVPG